MPALGPVFRYEMYAAGRRTRYFWLRSIIGLAMLGLLWITYQSVRSFRDGDLTIAEIAGLVTAFYIAFACSTMFGVLAVTPVIAAGAIATERERRTIEYLFATDLSNAEIVLDKLLARLLTVGKLVIAALPVLAIFRLLGGVPGDLLLMHFALLATTATLTASIALMVGVWCDRARDAASRALGAVAIALCALPLLYLILALFGLLSNPAVGFFAPVADWIAVWLIEPLIAAMNVLHPLVALTSTVGVGAGPLGIDVDVGALVKTCVAQLGVSAVLLTICIFKVRRVHLEASGAPGVKRVRKRSKSRSRSVYEVRPLLWKEMYAAESHRTGRRWRQRLGGLALAVIVGAVMVSTIYYTGFGPESYVTYMGSLCLPMATIFGSILVLVMGARAAGLISNERERDTWLSLLTTPLSAGQIVTAKTLGNYYAFRWQFLGVALIPLSAAVYSPMALVATAGFLFVLTLVAWAATSIGLAASLRMSNSIKAVGATIFILLGISAFYPALAATFLSIARAPTEVFGVLVVPPVAPFLMIAPMLFSVEQGMPNEFIVAFAGGVLFYAFLAFATAMSSVHNLDRICERGDGDRPIRESLAHGARRLTNGSSPT